MEHHIKLVGNTNERSTSYKLAQLYINLENAKHKVQKEAIRLMINRLENEE